jgi:hypothetical protein
MVTLRVVRHDRHEKLLGECLSSVIPARGETLQLDTVNSAGEPTGASTMWRIVAVTMHVPSVSSAQPLDGSALCVTQVEVRVLPDVSLVPEFATAAQEILSESRM